MSEIAKKKHLKKFKVGWYVQAKNCWKRTLYKSFLEASSLLEFFGTCSPICNKICIVMHLFEQVANFVTKRKQKSEINLYKSLPKPKLPGI